MTVLVSPANQLIYECISRRASFLELLSRELGLVLSKNFKFQEFPLLSHACDDRPVETYLWFLVSELKKAEESIGLSIESSQKASVIIEKLKKISFQFGIELAHTLIESKKIFGNRPLQEFLPRVLFAAEVAELSFVLRRSTPNEFEYELNNCVHSRAGQSNIMCVLYAVFIEGILSVLHPKMKYIRNIEQKYCVDCIQLK